MLDNDVNIIACCLLRILYKVNQPQTRQFNFNLLSVKKFFPQIQNEIYRQGNKSLFRSSPVFYLLNWCLWTFQQSVSILDPSDIYRPDIASYAEKDLEKFRDYSVVEDDPIKERVRQTYAKMHRNQTVDFVQGTFCLIALMFEASLRFVVKKAFTSFHSALAKAITEWDHWCWNNHLKKLNKKFLWLL